MNAAPSREGPTQRAGHADPQRLVPLDDLLEVADEAIAGAPSDPGEPWRRASVEEVVHRVAAEHGPAVVCELAVVLALRAAEAVESFCRLDGTVEEDLPSAVSGWLEATR